MDNVDDYVTGHEDEIVQFDFEGFTDGILAWHEDIREDLKKDKYNMTLLCVDAVLSSVEDMIYDNTLIID